MIKNIAAGSINPDNFLETEFISLIDKAKDIYTEKKKRFFWRKKDQINDSFGQKFSAAFGLNFALQFLIKIFL